MRAIFIVASLFVLSTKCIAQTPIPTPSANTICAKLTITSSQLKEIGELSLQADNQFINSDGIVTGYFLHQSPVGSLGCEVFQQKPKILLRAQLHEKPELSGI
jgi:hypothetical protein